MSIWVIFKLLGSLALLMFGMKSMSEALQKMAGPQLRHVLGAMTTNRFTGMLTGMLVTASVQSSTATTVMTVSFVNAGLLTLAQAIWRVKQTRSAEELKKFVRKFRIYTITDQDMQYSMPVLMALLLCVVSWCLL